MKFVEKVKKFAIIALAGAMVILQANTLLVHAQTISQVSVSKPGYGNISTESGSGVNVRNAPNLVNSDIIISVPNKSALMIVGESGDFYKVQYDTAGHYGYVLKEYLNFVPQDYYLQVNTSSSALNMRAYPDATSNIRTTIPKGTNFAYVATVNDWYMGLYGNVSGFTVSEYTLCHSY